MIYVKGIEFMIQIMSGVECNGTQGSMACTKSKICNRQMMKYWNCQNPLILTLDTMYYSQSLDAYKKLKDILLKLATSIETTVWQMSAKS